MVHKFDTMILFIDYNSVKLKFKQILTNIKIV